MDINPHHLVVSVHGISAQAEGWTLNPKRGVRITHKPSGIVVESNEERSEFQNRKLAMERLQIKVDEWDAAGRPAPALIGGPTSADALAMAIAILAVPNPEKVDLERIKNDLENDV